MKSKGQVNGRRYTLVIVSTAILIFSLLSSVTSIFSRETVQGPASQSLNHSSYPAILRDAFFPREPRLQDVQPLSGFAPAGIASYGANGSIIQTSSVRGITTINQIGIGFFQAEIINDTSALSYAGIGNATLQENAVLWLGSLGTYWTQNVLSITENNPASYTLQLINNIWNFTSLTSNMHQSGVQGNGSVQCITLSNSTSCAYITADPTLITVTPPFTVTLTMSIGAAGGAADVLFQYQIQDSSGVSQSGQYDSARLYPSNSRVSSYFQIGGESPLSESLLGGTTLTLPSDLELVFGGPGSGSSVFVNSISGSQELFYWNGASYVSVPDAFSVGSDTGESASGVAVTSNLGNPSLPYATLSSGDVSSQKLWPLPVAFVIKGDNDFQSGYLDLLGQALFATGSNTVASASNITVLESSSGGKTITDANGKFEFLFKPTHSGTTQETISYPGSIAFEKSSLNLQISTSSITISGANGGEVVGFFNSTESVIQNKNNFFVPVLAGTSLVVTFQNSTSSGSQSENFLGFGSGNQKSIVLNGKKPQNVTANFSELSTGILSPLSIIIYTALAGGALVGGLVIGYFLSKRTPRL
jgi:hypothetical protein